ncbi:MAG: IS1595 family transposase [Myxococcales bacterium]|nr:MAG: IS1595 family transposase [Myxococcales bacterium]USN50248.1 MAG: IS1595 family transposase [Myxococcales bacterium]USN50531.1 MAG: IS1595 family transposase [Myxococcales bacterium]USN51088.1 MAG: IS1595 family transposase [Myxococcales bacterium]USN51120.1 MAG: IS1595 family transposase [Myxococcales bacterium]
MYKRRSRLTVRQQSELIKLFVAGVTARAASELVIIQSNTASNFFLRLRKLIASKLPSYDLSGEIEVDESYFGGVRKGKRGRGAGGKVAVFGLLKRGGKVYTAIIPNAKTETLLPIVEEKVLPDSIVYTDTFKSYNALDVSAFHHMRINHSKLFADKQNHINGIENFWNQAKRNLRKFNGIKQDNFYWFLKECEWRFNGGNHQQLLKQLKYWYKHTKH